jgi:hypothetical protein
MLMEDLVRYIEDIVEPTIREFEDHPTSVRHAFIACVAVYHGIDYLAFPRTKPKALKQRFVKQSHDFAIVNRVAHAFKHVAAGPRANPSLRASDVISRPPAIWGQMVWDLSRWDDAIGGVTLSEEREVDLLDAVKNAVKFLQDQGAQSVKAKTSSATEALDETPLSSGANSPSVEFIPSSLWHFAPPSTVRLRVLAGCKLASVRY